MSFDYLKYATQFRLGEDSAPIYIIRAHTHTRDAWNVTDGHAKNFLSKDGKWYYKSGSDENCIFDTLNDAFAAAGKLINISHSLIQSTEQTYQRELERWKKENQLVEVGQEANIMKYDKEKDKELFKREADIGNEVRIIASVYSYNEGTPKVQLHREVVTAQGDRQFQKLGRLEPTAFHAVMNMLQEINEANKEFGWWTDDDCKFVIISGGKDE